MEKGTCPIERIIQIFGKRHMLNVLRLFYEKNPRRFNEIMREINIGPKTLSDRLKELNKTGIVERIPIAEIPPRVDYSLTEKGHKLESIFEELTDWAREYYSDDE